MCTGRSLIKCLMFAALRGVNTSVASSSTHTVISYNTPEQCASQKPPVCGQSIQIFVFEARLHQIRWREARCCQMFLCTFESLLPLNWLDFGKVQKLFSRWELLGSQLKKTENHILIAHVFLIPSLGCSGEAQRTSPEAGSQDGDLR